MEEDKRFISHVWSRGWQDTTAPYRKNKWNLLKNAVFGGIFAIVTFVLGGEPELTSFFIAGISGIAGAIIWGLIVLGKNLLTAPARLYYQQQSEISSKSIEISNLEYKISGGGINVEIVPTTRHRDQYASLKVYNSNEFTSVYCKPYLKRIVYLYTPTNKLDKQNESTNITSLFLGMGDQMIQRWKSDQSNRVL